LQGASRVLDEGMMALTPQGMGVKCWVQKELARESNGSPSERIEGTWLQLIRSCALCWLHGSRFQSESKNRMES